MSCRRAHIGEGGGPEQGKEAMNPGPASGATWQRRERPRTVSVWQVDEVPSKVRNVRPEVTVGHHGLPEEKLQAQGWEPGAFPER